MRLNRRSLLQAAALTASPILNVGQLAAASRGHSSGWSMYTVCSGSSALSVSSRRS